MKILFTFNGDRDPDYIDAKSKEKMDGPILSLLRDYHFDVIELFFTPDKGDSIFNTINAVTGRYPAVKVNCQPVKISDPISHQEIMSELRRCKASILKQYEAADYFIYVSPGTPQMHSSWLLLAGSGEIPAKLLQTRDPRQQKEGQKPIEEIDPRASWFPHIVQSMPAPVSPPSLDVAEVEKAIKNAGIIGGTETIQKIVSIAQPAISDATIMINGESGTGKELLARFIHLISKRKNKKFVPINCAAIPENLIESELFGYEKGAFTGANEPKVGLIEEAHEGTLFLDEIGDMSLMTQTKILRVIQQQELQRLGASKPVKVNLRIITATHKDLQDLVQKGLFREDLFYRLRVVPFTLPPLRERPQDIILLVDYFKEKLNENMKTTKKFTSDALLKLQKHTWRGNIRELSNVIERAFVQSWHNEIVAEDISFDEWENKTNSVQQLPELTEGFSLEDHISVYRERIIKKAMDQAKDQSSAAKMLGITSAALSKRKLKKSTPSQ